MTKVDADAIVNAANSSLLGLTFVCFAQCTLTCYHDLLDQLDKSEV